MTVMKRPERDSASFSRRLLRWPVFLLANAVFFLLIGVSTVRESVRSYTVEREIKNLEAQAESLEGRKLQLTALTGSLGTPEQFELDVRKRLGWKKEGENVAVLAGYVATTTTAAPSFDQKPALPVAPQPSNMLLWWNYFFGNNS